MGADIEMKVGMRVLYRIRVGMGGRTGLHQDTVREITPGGNVLMGIHWYRLAEIAVDEVLPDTKP